MLILLMILLVNGCSVSHKGEKIISFRYFNNNNKEYNIELIKKHLKLLDENNNDITNDEVYGFKKNDSTNYLSFRGSATNIIRKIIKNSDTMVLYFKLTEEKDNTLNIACTIDSLTFKKGKFLLEWDHYSHPLLFELYWAKYYNEYVNIVLNDKNNNPNYKESTAYKELSGMRKKLLKTKYDYNEISSISTYETAKFLNQKEYTYSNEFMVNGRKYFWEFSYKKPKKNASKGWIDLIDHNLVDSEKEEVMLNITNGLRYQNTMGVEDLKNGNKRYCKFIDVNFDGKLDLVQGPYFQLDIYLFNDEKKSFEFFEYLTSSKLEVDSINKKLVATREIGRFKAHIREKTIVYFKKNGNLDFIEVIEKEAKKIGVDFYHIITKRKKVMGQILKMVEEKVDTVKVKSDYWAYDFYKERL